MTDNSDQQPEEEKESTMDKVVMGAIIGTAIGSAIGISMAPKKGKETRKIVKSKSKDVLNLTKETGFGIWKIAKRLIFGKKAKGQKSLLDSEEMQKIPTEIDVIPPKYVDRD